ncbi:uncharacterized protein LOC34619055 [Cyclospora cayetanensis]|uniref:Uncharacterized protein LOC34619055 n=1 Tax=Cyclospora cayetanensis TaxID=88456 RepID=A0A6P6S2M5_9EIME|nr:uncharacterized protein LOC34619055 [Cyclospora cayetanensis]
MKNTSECGRARRGRHKDRRIQATQADWYLEMLEEDKHENDMQHKALKNPDQVRVRLYGSNTALKGPQAPRTRLLLASTAQSTTPAVSDYLLISPFIRLLYQQRQQQRVVVAFDISKGDDLDPNKPSLRRCCQLLRQLGCVCVVNKASLTLSRLQKHQVSLLIIGQPSKPYTTDELLAIKLFLETPQTNAAPPGPAAAADVPAAASPGDEARETSPALESASGASPAATAVDRSSAATDEQIVAASHGTMTINPAPTVSTKTVLAPQARSVFVLGGSSGGSSNSSNTNFLLEEMGLSIATDTVVAVTPPTLQEQQRGIWHPREVVLNQKQLVGANIQQHLQPSTTASSNDTSTFVYPYGSTVYVQPPAVPLMCSSRCSSPSQRPLIAAAPAAGGGVVVAAGSSKLLQEPYLSMYKNTDLVKVLLHLLLGRMSLQELRPTAAETAAAITKYTRQTDTELLSQLPQPCIEAPPEVPKDFRLLHQQQCYTLRPRLVLQLQQLLQRVNLNPIGAPLELIQPKLLQPFPSLKPALHPPILPSPPPLPLPLLDIDTLCMSPSQRLLAAAGAAGASIPTATANVLDASAETEKERVLQQFVLKAAKITGILPEQQPHQQATEEAQHTERTAGNSQRTARSVLVKLLVHSLKARGSNSLKQVSE